MAPKRAKCLSTPALSKARAISGRRKTMKSRFLFTAFSAPLLALSLLPAQAQNYSVSATCAESPNASGSRFATSGGTYYDLHTGANAASANANAYFYDPVEPTYPASINSTASVAGQQGLITGAVTSATAQTVSIMATAKANWTDTLTVASSSLTSGTPVQILLLASYKASTYAVVYNPLAGGISGAGTSLDFESTATDAATSVSTPLVFKKTDAAAYNGFGQPGHNYDMSMQATLNTTVGATINLTSLVDMEVGGGVTFQGFKVSTKADISSFSSSVFVNAPDGVSVVSASGHSYAATPAPASLPVFAAGAGVFFLSLVRRRRAVAQAR